MPDSSFTGICDCHVHVVGPSDRFPQAPGRAYTAAPATLQDLRAASSPSGVSRYVLVQPSFYGTDNSFLLETLDALGENGRGVVVIEPAAMTASKLDQLARRGACGVRLNLYSKFSPLSPQEPESLLRQFAAKLSGTCWHIEVIASRAVLAAVAPVIAESGVPVVLDHYGLPEADPESVQSRSLLDLAALPHVWIKLSAPYRVGKDPLATRPPAAWLAALLRVAPGRCVWGSDWPHAPELHHQRDSNLPVPYRCIDYRRTLDDFSSALPDAATAGDVLRSNACRLYGFRAAAGGAE